MNGDVIKSFLVGLGFGVDDASLAKFNKSIASATLKVTALYAATKAMSAAVVYGISEISEGFEQMGYEYRIIAPAINKVLIMRRELLKAYAAAGINITKVVQASVKLNMSLAKTKFAFEALYRSVASKFFGLLTKQSDLFRQKIYQNMPKIQLALEKFIKFIFKALEATTALGVRLWSILTRIYDFFVKLDKATDGWSTIILGVVAAWKLLNLSFLATPLGMIITGLVAILALFDDFKTWQEGGKSLFDWTNVVPVIDTLTSALGALWDVLRAIGGVLLNIVLAFNNLLHSDIKGFFSSLADASAKLWEMLQKVWDLSGKLSQLGETTFGALSNLFGGENAAANIKNNPTTSPVSNPVSPTSVANSQTNQNLQQQTNINVVGSADASSTAKAVASEQSKVNFDLSRNMKGATR